MIFYTNLFIPKRFKARYFAFLIFIRPECRDDRGMLEHEKTHVRQFWKSPILHGLYYWLSKKKRFEFEAEAYREQLKWYDDDRTDKFAQSLATKYDLGITFDEAKAALS